MLFECYSNAIVQRGEVFSGFSSVTSKDRVHELYQPLWNSHFAYGDSAMRHRSLHVHVWSTPHETAGRRYVYNVFFLICFKWKSVRCSVQGDMWLVCRKQEKHLRKWLRMVQKQRHLNLKVAWPSKWKKNRFRPLDCKSLVRACKAMWGHVRAK